VLRARALPGRTRFRSRTQAAERLSGMPGGAWGAAAQAALYAVLKESFKLYKALSEGLINLADRFFEMDHAHAVKGLEAYREAIAGSNSLQARRVRARPASMGCCSQGLLLLGPAVTSRESGCSGQRRTAVMAEGGPVQDGGEGRREVVRQGHRAKVERGVAAGAQAYYRDMERIEELKRAVQFPVLEPPPADFLSQMENYCAEAPRALDDAVAAKKARPLAGPAAPRVSGWRSQARPVPGAAERLAGGAVLREGAAREGRPNPSLLGGPHHAWHGTGSAAGMWAPLPVPCHA